MFSTFMDFNDVYNEFEENNSDNAIKRLLDLTKFSNLKMQERLNDFKIKNYKEIQEFKNPK